MLFPTNISYQAALNNLVTFEYFCFAVDTSLLVN